jgi:hypothetical protein
MIEKYYKTKEKNIDEISIILNRKKRSIQERIKKLSLHIRPCKKWEKEEIEFLIENYPMEGADYCAIYLNRSKDSVWQKVNELSISYISKTHKLDKYKKDIIRDYEDGLKIKDIAQKYTAKDYIILEALKKWNIDMIGLKNKHIKSKSINWSGYKDITGTYWGSVKKSAKERNLEFNISIYYIWNLFLSQNEKCSLSGIPIYFNQNSQEFKTSQTASLDRIDSSKGYIEGNVQWVHKEINFMKRNLHDNEFIELCRKVVETRIGKL